MDAPRENEDAVLSSSPLRSSVTSASSALEVDSDVAEALARALRALAGELERDPALARRVADAMGTDPYAAAHTVIAGATAAPPPASQGASADTDGGGIDAAKWALTAGRRSFQPRLVTGAPPDLGPGVPDPFVLRERLGDEGLCAALAELRVGTLRAMIREHRLDPAARLKGVNDARKLRAAILAALK